MNNLTLTSFGVNPDLGRWMIGADQLLDTLTNASNAANMSKVSYPPYNVICHDHEHYSIEIAVAGFGEKDLQVTVDNRILTVTGEVQDQSESEVVYTHRGLSRRKFQREWRLIDYMEVVGASVKNGIMTIQLERQLPEELKPRNVAINFVR